MVELLGARYYFVGRKDGIINVGGRKVHPEEVEAVINRHPNVQMSLVSGRKNPITGAIVVADVVVKTDSHPDTAETAVQRLKSDIIEICRRHVASVQGASDGPIRAFARGRAIRQVEARVMNKTVIVTGGSRGLGLGIAIKLVSAGYQVVTIARHESEHLKCAMRRGNPGPAGSLLFRPFDLERTADIPALIKQLRKEFGPIGGLVNNAGLGTSGILATMHDSRIERLVRLNTVSAIIMTKYVCVR